MSKTINHLKEAMDIRNKYTLAVGRSESKPQAANFVHEDAHITVNKMTLTGIIGLGAALVICCACLAFLNIQTMNYVKASRAASENLVLLVGNQNAKIAALDKDIRHLNEEKTTEVSHLSAKIEGLQAQNTQLSTAVTDFKSEQARLLDKLIEINNTIKVQQLSQPIE